MTVKEIRPKSLEIDVDIVEEEAREELVKEQTDAAKKALRAKLKALADA